MAHKESEYLYQKRALLRYQFAGGGSRSSLFLNQVSSSRFLFGYEDIKCHMDRLN